MKNRLLSVLLCISMLVSITVISGAEYASPTDAATATDAEEKLISVIYRINGEENVLRYTEEDFTDHNVFLPEEYNHRFDGENKVIIGWKYGSGSYYYCDNKDISGIYGEPADEYCLSPIYADVMFRRDEVYGFTNHSANFTKRGSGYYISLGGRIKLISDAFLAMVLAPFSLISDLTTIIGLAYSFNSEWDGSCFGMVLTLVLNKLGKIDLPAYQNVDKVDELVPDDKLVSMINYYQMVQYAEMDCVLKNEEPGSDGYLDLFEQLYSRVESGIPSLFSVHTSVISHTILATGCYRDGNGNPVIIYYDPNYHDYNEGKAPFIRIDRETKITEYKKHVVNTLVFVTDYDHYDAFRYDGLSYPLEWAKYNLKRSQTLITLKELI